MEKENLVTHICVKVTGTTGVTFEEMVTLQLEVKGLSFYHSDSTLILPGTGFNVAYKEAGDSPSAI